MRFDPGVEVTVRLVPIGGERVVIGFSGLVDGPLDAPGALESALTRAREFGFLGAGPAVPRRPRTRAAGRMAESGRGLTGW